MKKLVTGAVIAAVLTPMSIMAAVGPTLYGKIHMSVDSHDNNGSGAANYDEMSLNSNNSAIGIKGSENLGNGMKVGYLIEWTIAMDGDETGGADRNFGQRNRAITLSGVWGTVLAGRWNSPFKMLSRKLDLFGDRIGDTRNLSWIGNGSSPSTSENYFDNVVQYVTPNMNGFSATVAYSFDMSRASTADNSDNSAVAANAIYKNGPAMLGLAYVKYDDQLKTATSTDSSAWRVGGSYKFGDFKVVGVYTDFDDQQFIKNNSPDMWTLGGSYNMGNNTIKLQYSDRDESDSNKDDGADMWSIGLDHMMSKRTTVYAAYASTDNDDLSSLTSWFGGHDREGAPAQGEDADSFSVGIIHRF